ncbi:DNA damage-inducible protein [Entamoeba marina]
MSVLEEEQQRIQSTIQKNQINEQKLRIEQEHPELLIPGDLVFISLRVNGVTLPAMIDSGAQESVISLKTCRQCNLENQIDKKFTKSYQGMGQCNSIGIVYVVPLVIGTTYCITSLNVLSEESPMDHLLIGTNTLRSLACSIDFGSNSLILKDEKIPFLSNTEVDYVLHKPFHISPISQDYKPSKRCVIKPNLPILKTELFPRYSNGIIQQLVFRGFNLNDAMNMLDVTGGDIDEAIRKVMN